MLALQGQFSPMRKIKLVDFPILNKNMDGFVDNYLTERILQNINNILEIHQKIQFFQS